MVILKLMRVIFGSKLGRSAPGKAVIFGMLKRGGDVMTQVVANVKRRTPLPVIRENVKSGSTVHTGELRSCSGLDKIRNDHKKFDHGAGKRISSAVMSTRLSAFGLA